MGREQSWSYAATNERVAVGRQQVPGQNHRADPTDSNGDGLANTDQAGVGRPLGPFRGKDASRCRLSMDSGTDELLAQRP